jgi:hypothetical protein
MNAALTALGEASVQKRVILHHRAAAWAAFIATHSASEVELAKQRPHQPGSDLWRDLQQARHDYDLASERYVDARLGWKPSSSKF